MLFDILVTHFAKLGTCWNTPSCLLGWIGTGRWLVHTRVILQIGLHHGQVIADVSYNRCQNATLIKSLLLIRIRIRRNAQQLKG